MSPKKKSRTGQQMTNVASQTEPLYPAGVPAESTGSPIDDELFEIMAMSTDTSPQHASRMASAFHTGPMAHHPNQHAPPIHMHPGAYHDSSSISVKDDSLNHHMDHQHHGDSSQSNSNNSGGSGPTPTKGKNGATGPADGKTKPHICQICSRGFTTGGHLQRHQRIHTGVKAFMCPFPGCETRTSRQDNLQQHYRTHLSPTLRRGSGSAARAAVNAAMESAGLKSSTTRAPRKSKGSGGGTPSSATSAQSHMPSPYATPTSGGPMPYGAPYLYDPQHGYPPYGMPHPMAMGQPQSGNSSRVPSPVNGHSSAHSSVGSMQQAHHQPYFNGFAPSYYPGMPPHQQYRYGPGPAVPSPYGTQGHPHHGIYSPGLGPDHHNYSPMQNTFPTHTRDPSYGATMPGYGQNPMANGYPPRTQTSTPLSQSHEADDRYRRGPSPRRRTPPGSHDMLSQGVLDPQHMTTNRQPGGMPPSYVGYGGPPMGYGGYPAPAQTMPQHGAPGMSHRASISSLSDGGSGNGSNHANGNGDSDMKG